ncbi:hypothetical protein ACR9HT_08020 [Enterobacter wuhouensis]|uniref:hypothetical protein n=1 Tax=Enterobacter wuhouensis TaxID=2529381 RepID=UPI0021E625A6|nr:hypothetical protein [Enterobacter wuhouensis]MCV2533840.1 hypothetical protein [Enterobacter wuhouensis]
MKKNSKTRSRRGFDGRKKLMEDFKQQRVILISGIASGLTELQRKSAGHGCLFEDNDQRCPHLAPPLDGNGSPVRGDFQVSQIKNRYKTAS